jgi:hypothetical protein
MQSISSSLDYILGKSLKKYKLARITIFNYNNLIKTQEKKCAPTQLVIFLAIALQHYFEIF